MSAVRDRLIHVIAEASGPPVDPPALIPADIAIELAGEAVRPRLCIVAMPQQLGDRALRPDLTLPLALGRIADVQSGREVPDRVSYAGRAWRVPSSGAGPVEFEQVGFEWFGLERSAETDAEAFALTWQALAATGIDDTVARLGDVSVFAEIVSALDLHPDWQARILAAAGNPKRLDGLLKSATENETPDPKLSAIAALPDREAETALEAYLSERGHDVVGHRPLSMVVERLRQKVSLAGAGSLPAATRLAIAEALGLECPVSDAARVVSALASDHDIAGLDAIADRLDAIHSAIARHVPKAEAVFSVRSGLSFNYYDGFVFDIATGAAPKLALASGGRYDGLLSRLSQGAVSATAIGAVLRPERIEAALAGGDA